MTGARQLSLPTDSTCSPCRFPDVCGDSAEDGACGPLAAMGVLHPGHPDFMDRVREVGGLDHSITKARPVERVNLPGFLPQVDDRTTPADMRMGTVGVTLARWDKIGGLRTKGLRSLHDRLALGPDAIIVLLMLGADRLLDRAYADRSSFLDALEVLRPDVVAGPAYSVWPGRPAVDQRYEQRRGLKIFGELQDRGFHAIPAVDWGSERDRDAWARWLDDNLVNHILLDMQCQAGHLRAHLRELATFRSMLSRPPAALVNGLTQPRRISDCFAAWPDATFTADTVGAAANGYRSMPAPDGSLARRRRPSASDPTGFWPQSVESQSQVYRAEVETLRGVVDAARLVAMRSAA